MVVKSEKSFLGNKLFTNTNKLWNREMESCTLNTNKELYDKRGSGGGGADGDGF